MTRGLRVKRAEACGVRQGGNPERTDGGQAVGADECRGGKPGELVDEAGLKEGRGDGGTALDENAGQAGAAEGRQGVWKCGRRDEADAGGDEGGAAVLVGGRVVDRPDWVVARGADHPAVERQAELPVENDPDQRAGPGAVETAGQIGIVGQGGADANEDGVVFGTQAVGLAAGRLAGDPAAFARRGGDAAVEGGGKLERDQRAALLEASDEAGDQGGGLAGEEAGLDGQAGRAEAGKAASVDARVGIADGRDDTGDAGVDQRVGAGRGDADVRAGFEGDVGGPATGAVAGLGQGLGLGMGTAAGSGGAAADHMAVCRDDDTADGWVGPGFAEVTAAESEGRPHVVVLGGQRGGRCLMSSAPRNCSKSLVSRKSR